ncbi:WD40 repeat domain-containing protein [Corallococcus sp. Z5C101001]|uniref:WD40 repeat domain-containing protein n=1 Tax=Corallococcus sp. Z5C101001 TaxID=2596829 RepID=UPI00118024EC|nr:hypothetical protein [Corallococcus sp. Z5C101001]TSC24540.1 hypothetical protein FOF48_26135 [Corallococcus sp. Z5C101001]
MSSAIITPTNAARLERVRQLRTSRSTSDSGQKLAFDSRGTRLVSTAQRGSHVCWWDLTDASDAPVHGAELTLTPTLAFIPLTNLVVGAGPPVASAATPWRPRLMGLSARDGTLLRETAMPHVVSSLGASRGGRLLMLFEEGEALLWDAADWRPVRELRGWPESISVNACTVSPDGRFAAAVARSDFEDRGRFWLWDLATDALPWSLSLDAPFLWSIAFHPTEPLLVVGGNTNEVAVVDAAERRVVRTLSQFDRYACNLDFSPDGRLLVASGDGRGFVVHRFDTGDVLFFHGDDNNPQTSDAVFSPDGRGIAWGQGDGTVGLWCVTDEAPALR